MNKFEKRAASEAIAEKVFATENAIDTAMIAASQLIEDVVASHRSIKIPSAHLEVARARLVECMAALEQARRGAVASHTALAAYGRKDPEIGECPMCSPGESVSEMRMVG
jgi:hemoglobin-like flavoprotein